MASRRVRRLGVLAATTLIGIVGLVPAYAGQLTATVTVSCDGVSWAGNGVYLQQSAYGPASVRQNTTSPTSSTVVHLQSSTGNNTSDKTVSDGQTVSWTVARDTTGYRVWGRRSTSKNCNGIGFGYGNYDWTYTETTS